MAQHSLMQVGASGRSHVHVAYLRFVRQSSFFTAHWEGVAGTRAAQVHKRAGWDALAACSLARAFPLLYKP